MNWELHNLKAIANTAIDELQGISHLLAIMHNHQLEPEEQATLLFTIWEKVGAAIDEIKRLDGGA